MSRGWGVGMIRFGSWGVDVNKELRLLLKCRKEKKVGGGVRSGRGRGFEGLGEVGLGVGRGGGDWLVARLGVEGEVSFFFRT